MFDTRGGIRNDERTESIQDDKIIVLADTEYFTARTGKNKGKQKLSRIMAMILGAVVTVELLIMGAMFLNVDFQSADRLALLLGAVVLYFGVVALLTDK